MRWQIIVEPLPGGPDSLGVQVARKLRSLGIAVAGVRTARLYLLEGEIDAAGAERLAKDLLADAVAERASVHAWERYRGEAPGAVAVFKKPGVMDPVEAGLLRGAAALGLPLNAARTGMRYRLEGLAEDALVSAAERALANEAIERIQAGNDRFPAPPEPRRAPARRQEIPIRKAGDAELEDLSRRGGLSLTLLEMRAIQSHYRELGREPSDVELETIAQTWSEHCKHKTMTGAVRYHGPSTGSLADGALIPNLLGATIKDATRRLARPFCLSVFHDNAGVIAFDGDQALCFKVETHNHPSAIEPYGGAGTGIGGVIRDVLGTGLGARPVANTDVYCVAPPDLPASEVPKGALHPLRLLRGVVEGVRDYGNQMGIPTVNGAVVFDERYVGNPLVFCGTVGLLPSDKVEKAVHAGDVIVVLGGRTGRDGIHGATFSSAELHEASETVDAGAVQIGNAITEKKVMDVLLQARDRGLYTAITDCGAGGFSSAVGEMGEEVGARVHLERALLKYEGLEPAEIWISESQERMVLAVPPAKVQALLELCASEDVEAFVLGEFSGTGRLEIASGDVLVGELDMRFLHEGLPRVEREARFEPRGPAAAAPSGDLDPAEALTRLLRHPDVASKEWIIRQYDHEVQAGSVVKPLVGTRGHGPSDGAVLAPLLGRTVGFALGCGIQPRLGDLDPYVMAQVVIDEAVRNVVALGADPDHCAILDNFAWGNTSRPETLGELVRAAFGCRDAALALGTPFISGKDSLNNEFRTGDRTIVIPPTLLVSAIARVPDVRNAVTMDLKRAGSRLYVLGATGNGLAGSLFHRIIGRTGGELPRFEGERARDLFRALHRAIASRAVLACHDLSDGGLAVAAAEMVLAGEIGAEIELSALPAEGAALDLDAALFSEGPSRFLVEVAPAEATRFEAGLAGLPFACVGRTKEVAELVLRPAPGRPPVIELGAALLEESFRWSLHRHLEGAGLDRGDRHG